MIYAVLVVLWIAIGYEIGNSLINRLVEKHGSVTALSKKKRPDRTRRNIDRFGADRVEKISRRVMRISLIVGWPFFLIKALWDVLT